MAQPTTRTCENCGAVYERTLNKSPVRDQDSFECLDCGMQLDKWSSSVWPSYRKIKDGTVTK
jgi:hypothetical protein